MGLTPLAYVLLAGLVTAAVCGLFGLACIANHVHSQEALAVRLQAEERETIPTYSRTNHVGDN